MAKYLHYHICPECGRRIRCDRPEPDTQPAQVYDLAASHVELTPSRAYSTLRYETYWANAQMANAFFKVVAFTILPVVGATVATVHNHWPEVIPGYIFVISLCVSLRLFGKVPEWHNLVETEPPAQPDPAPDPAPEDTRKFVGWETETHTHSSQKLEWYTPPVPIQQAQSFALALVNNHFEWVDERDLRAHRANISHGNYRTLRHDWLDRGWCAKVGANGTTVTNNHMIRRIAFESPE
jgi:hypothetical protein